MIENEEILFFERKKYPGVSSDLNTDNPYFIQMVDQIYPTEL